MDKASSPPKVVAPASEVSAAGVTSVSAPRLPFRVSTVLRAGGLAGTAITLIYYARIGFLPIDGLADLVTLGGVVVLASAVLLSALLGSWLAPWALMFWVVQEVKNPRTLRWFESRRDNRVGQTKYSRWRVFQFSALTVGVGWSMFMLSLLDSTSAQGNAETSTTSEWLLLWWSQWDTYVIAVTLIALSIYGLRDFLSGPRASVAVVRKRIEARLKQRRRTGRHARPLTGWRWLLGVSRWIGVVVRLLLSVGAGATSVLPLMLLLSIATLSSDLWVDDSIGRFILVISIGGLLSVLTLAMSLYLTMSRKHGTAVQWQAPLALNALVFVWGLTVIGVWTPLHDAVMSIVSIRVPSATIVLSPKACEALRLMDVTVWNASSDKPAGERACRLVNVTVLSRVGQRWWIDCGIPKTGSPGTAAVSGFAIASDDVHGWWRQATRRSAAPGTESGSICTADIRIKTISRLDRTTN